MNIIDIMDKFVKQKQNECEHFEQDITKFTDGEFCKCGKKILRLKNCQ